MKQLLLVQGNTKLTGVILVLLSITAGIAAQIAFFFSIQDQDMPGYFDIPTWWGKISTNASPLPGFFLYLLTAAFFIAGLRFLNDSAQPFAVHSGSTPQHRPKFGFWSTSFGLAIAAAFHAAQPVDRDDPAGYVFLALWILSIILFVFSILRDAGWRLPSGQETRDWFKIHRSELLVIATIIIAAFFVRFLAVGLYPYPFNNDEAEMGISGVCIIRGECTNFFYLLWAEQDTLAFLPYGISIAIFGKTAFAVRLVSVIVGTLSTLAAYLFAREVFNKQIAWIAGLLLATLPVHVHFSRLSVNNTVDSLSAPLILWILFRGIKRGSRLSFLAAGVVSGFCIYTYPGSVLAPVLGISALLYITIMERGFLANHIRHILIFMLTALLIVIPMLGYYSTHSNRILSRFKRESIMQSGILQRSMENTGKSAAEIIGVQFFRSSLVFIATPSPANFYNSPEPYLAPWAALLFVVGLVYAAWRIKNPIYMILFLWFWAPVILGSTLTSGPPTSQRMMMSMPALAIIIAIGMTKIIGALQESGKTVARFSPILLLILLLSIGYRDINFYFHTYRMGHFYEDPVNEFTYEAPLDIASLGSQGRVFMITTPGVPYLGFPNFSFFSPEVEKLYFDPVDRETLAVLPDNKDALLIATPDRKSDLEQLMQWLPGGEWNEVRRRYQPAETLYYSYRITKQQLEGFQP